MHSTPPSHRSTTGWCATLSIWRLTRARLFAFSPADRRGRTASFLLSQDTKEFGGFRSWQAAGVHDVLSHDPAAARELLGLAGKSKLAFDLTFPNRPRSREIAEILNNSGARL